MTALYRVGKSWRTTIVRTGDGPADERGRRPGDRLVGVVMGGTVVMGDSEPGLPLLVRDLLADDDGPQWHVVTVVGCPAMVTGGARTSDAELAERVSALLNADEFFEEDEPVEDVVRAFNEGERGRTTRPTVSALSEYPIGEDPPYDEPEGDDE